MNANLQGYLDPQCCIENMARYVIRRSVLDALMEQLPNFNGRFLDVGSGNQPYRTLIETDRTAVTNYIPLDLADNRNYLDAEIVWDGVTMPFETDSIDSAMATEVLEHCPNPTQTLLEISRVLKPGGLFFLTVPFVWPLHDRPYDEYRYTPYSLERHLQQGGFENICLRPTGGWDAALAQILGVWCQRSPMSDRRRKWVSRIAFPFFKHLIKRDQIDPNFGEHFYLMPGISGTATAN